jgi:hypothetical protein
VLADELALGSSVDAAEVMDDGLTVNIIEYCSFTSP